MATNVSTLSSDLIHALALDNMSPRCLIADMELVLVFSKERSTPLEGTMEAII